MSKQSANSFEPIARLGDVAHADSTPKKPKKKKKRPPTLISTDPRPPHSKYSDPGQDYESKHAAEVFYSPTIRKSDSAKALISRIIPSLSVGSRQPCSVLEAKEPGLARNLSTAQLSTLPQSEDSSAREYTTLTRAQSSTPVDEEGVQSFVDYIKAEACPAEKLPTADVLWRQTERDKVYNFLLYVPYQLERVILFGNLLCLDSFLGMLTVLPWRCAETIMHRRKKGLGNLGSRLFDLMCAAIVLAATTCLRMLKPGSIYYWMKDITGEFLKLQVVFTGLDICDKVLSNFGVDVLEALSGTCTLFTMGKATLPALLSDCVVCFCVTLLHGLVLMCQAMVYSVAMNSKKNALLALMIASNFTEVKGSVFKRMDPTKIWSMVCMDIVEWFHLSVVMLFVIVEDMDSGSSWIPSQYITLVCLRILFWECIIDVIKHAALCKFNDIRPGIYREYMRDMCDDVAQSQSHTLHKLIGFHPMGTVAVFLRILTTLFWLRADVDGSIPLRVTVCGIAWSMCFVGRFGFGYSLKYLAHRYLQYYNKWHAGKAGLRVIANKFGKAAKPAKLE